MQVVIGIALVLAAASVAGAGPLDTPGAMKALNCSACHGFAGQSAGDTMPILAGLWPEYFKKAIADYASGKRPSTEMEPYAKQVIQFGVDDYAVYFGGLKREPTKIAVDATAAGRGRAAAQPCVICHGPDGRDRKSTRLNSSHRCSSYAVFRLKKKSCVTRGERHAHRHRGRAV